MLREVGTGHHRPDRGARAGRQEAVRAARRHRDDREHSADLRVDHEQEAGGGQQRAGARRQVRRRRVHEGREAGHALLARSMVAIGTQAGVRTEAFITDMDAPLGRAIGNALEIIECLDVAEGRGSGRPGGRRRRAWRRGCWCSRGVETDDAARAGRGCASAIGVRRGAATVRADDRAAGRRSPGRGRLRAAAAAPSRRDRVAPTAPGS